MSVLDLLNDYLIAQLNIERKGYSTGLRIANDCDVKYYLSKGYSVENALFADTIISFWTIYKRLLFLETGWKIYAKTPNCIKALIKQIESTRKNRYTHLITKINAEIESFCDLIYTKGNYMLLPDKQMNTERYSVAEDRIDISIYEMFRGGKLSKFFHTDEDLIAWLKREHLVFMFKDGIISKDNIIWFVERRCLISEMSSTELKQYINSAEKFINYRTTKV